MKSMERSISKGPAALLIFILISLCSLNAAQIQKTFTWKYPVNRETNLTFDNYNCDLAVHAWDRSEIEYHLTVEATGKTADDEARLLKYIENFNFGHSGSAVNFSSTFWKNRRNINGKTTLEIEGEKDINLTEFNMKAELWVPAGNALVLESKYSRIDLESFGGKLRLDLYNDNLYGNSLTNTCEISAKYSNFEFRDIKDLNAELYNCDFEAANTGYLTIVSKYSKVNAKSTGKLDIDSYNDKFSFENTGEVNFRAKYSDLKTTSSGNMTIDCYNGSVISGVIDKMEITSKYAEIKADKANEIDASSSFNDKFSFGKINILKIGESKYTGFRADELATSLIESDGFNDNFDIKRTGAGFRGIEVSGKYIDISMGIPVSTDFRLKAAIKYPEIEINEAAYKVRIKVLENADLQFEGVRGTEKADLPLVDVKGFEMKLKISDIK